MYSKIQFITGGIYNLKRTNGLHLYININNFNDILEAEEKEIGKPLHSIHALDSFFSSVELFAKRTSKDCTIEKITGARLHIFIEGTIEDTYSSAKKIVYYAKKISSILLDQVAKYKSLVRFKIHAGMDYGKFHIFQFIDHQYSEITSIGYSANYAAKLQHLTDSNHMSISDNIYDYLPDFEKTTFKKIFSSSITKYEKSYYYTCPLLSLQETENTNTYVNYALEYANRVNLNEINFSSANQPVNFDSLSKKECKKLEGIPLFADVRGFTSKFNEDDSNLEEMSIKTQNILKTMYETVKKHNGIHIQFQGDREFALFHNYKDHTCYIEAVLTGLKIIDGVKSDGVCVGVGQNFGNLFASKIGARNEKDYILLGRAVNIADKFEDKYACENQLVISNIIYQNIKELNPNLANLFTRKDDYYFTTLGYKHYLDQIQLRDLEKNTHQKSYNGAYKNDQ